MNKTAVNVKANTDETKEFFKDVFKKLIIKEKINKFNTIIDSMSNFDLHLEDYTFAMILMLKLNKCKSGNIESVLAYAKKLTDNADCDIHFVNVLVLNYHKMGPQYAKNYYGKNAPIETKRAITRVQAQNKLYNI